MQVDTVWERWTQRLTVSSSGFIDFWKYGARYIPIGAMCLSVCLSVCLTDCLFSVQKGLKPQLWHMNTSSVGGRLTACGATAVIR